MKTLMISIMIGLLAMSPAFAAAQDDGQRTTSQTQREGTDGQVQGQEAGDRDILPRYDSEREVVIDPVRPHRTLEVDPMEGYERVAPELITVEDLRNADVYDVNHENLGNVDEVLISQEGEIERVVLNVGGFLGLGAHSIAIGIDELEIHQDADDDLRVYVPMTEEELRNHPEYRPDN
ncbi:PRC-barrel domain-containing protein [Desulfonatronum thiosulfatophilum]|uniref:PRC-barrel domain-containing protein n=1 Tax=Desulfonatronum thiosulfatophilum TaxID=617002 RepID=A0A1G6CKE3_9BACT|nr:PRC-barrel domain-containing protein [Desulfonatronum thiosulfatophilum]SDB33364.1 PRC-barrel domain-containing protein [Desulfonatronum thiosulfatophilum]